MVHNAQLTDIHRVNRARKRKRGKVVRAQEEILVDENSLNTRNRNLRNDNDSIRDKLTILLVKHICAHLHRHN